MRVTCYLGCPTLALVLVSEVPTPSSGFKPWVPPIHRQSFQEPFAERRGRGWVDVSPFFEGPCKPWLFLVPRRVGLLGCQADPNQIHVENSAHEAKEFGVDLDKTAQRLDKEVRLIWHNYYSNSDVRQTRGALGSLLTTIMTALEAGASADDIASNMQARLLERAERLDYHLDGDDPMTLYRLWFRGRAVDVYERDLLHSPRWVYLIQETAIQLTQGSMTVYGRGGDVVGGGVREEDHGDMGTVCFPDGEMVEGKVSHLMNRAGVSPASAELAALEAQLAALKKRPTSNKRVDLGQAELWAGAGADGGGDDAVESVVGLVSLVVDCLEDGMNDEAVVFQRHLLGKECGHPLLQNAAPSTTEVVLPFTIDEEDEEELLQSEVELGEEELALGEREAKEMLYDRRRAQLDVYLLCAAYRAYKEAGLGARVRGSGEEALSESEEDMPVARRRVLHRH